MADNDFMDGFLFPGLAESETQKHLAGGKFDHNQSTHGLRGANSVSGARRQYRENKAKLGENHPNTKAALAAYNRNVGQRKTGKKPAESAKKDPYGPKDPKTGRRAVSPAVEAREKGEAIVARSPRDGTMYMTAAVRPDKIKLKDGPANEKTIKVGDLIQVSAGGIKQPYVIVAKKGSKMIMVNPLANRSDRTGPYVMDLKTFGKGRTEGATVDFMGERDAYFYKGPGYEKFQKVGLDMLKAWERIALMDIDSLGTSY